VGLVNHSIPSFIGGVSQQPASVRHPSQVEAMENMVPSVASGLHRRVGTQHVGKLAPGYYADAFVHKIDRGTAGTVERYFVVIENADLKVYDWTGAQHSVSFPNGKGYLSTTTFPSGTLARDGYVATSIADHTFIANRYIKPAMTPHSPGTIVQKLFVVVKVGVVDSSYTVTLDGTPYTYTIGNSAGVNKTTAIAGGIAALIPGGTYTVVQIDNLLVINRIDQAAFPWSVSDTYGNQALFGFTDQVNRYEQLPAKFVEGRVIQVTGDPNNADDSFYVLWQKRDTNAGGVWVEYLANNTDAIIDPDTMPYELVRNGDGTFTFQRVAWKNRLVGDDKSNPLPSFIGSTISDIFFLRNRLGFLADENAIMSQAGDYFNFFATTARAVLDSDPIDVSASTKEVTFLRHALAFQRSLLVLSDKHQFRLSADPTLTPKSAKLDPTTAFESDPSCKPVALGRNVYFPTPRGNFSAIREYLYDGNTVTDDAADTTAHVPSYVPRSVFRLTTADTEGMLIALTAQERNAVYIYNVYWNGDQKSQSAWHKWLLDTNDVIIAAEVFGTVLMLLVQRADNAYFETVELSEIPTSPANYTINLDRWVERNSGTYSAITDMTFWTLPYIPPVGATVRVILTNETGSIGQGLLADFASGNSVGLKGNHSGTDVVLGLTYLSRVKLSEQFYRDQEKNSVIAGRLQLRDMVVAFARAGYFEAHVTPLARDTDVYPYTGKPLGLADMIIGSEVIRNGSFRVPIQANSAEVDIEFRSDTHLPFALLSAEWEGFMAMQAARR